MDAQIQPLVDALTTLDASLAPHETEIIQRYLRDAIKAYDAFSCTDPTTA